MSKKKAAAPPPPAPIGAPMVEVESSNIESIGYDNGNELYVKFKGGNMYKYYNVPQEVHAAFMAAESKGKFFISEIKGRYTEEHQGKSEPVRDDAGKLHPMEDGAKGDPAERQAALDAKQASSDKQDVKAQELEKSAQGKGVSGSTEQEKAEPDSAGSEERQPGIHVCATVSIFMNPDVDRAAFEAWARACPFKKVMGGIQWLDQKPSSKAA